jgi:hypothetical protein
MLSIYVPSLFAMETVNETKFAETTLPDIPIYATDPTASATLARDFASSSGTGSVRIYCVRRLQDDCGIPLTSPPDKIDGIPVSRPVASQV